MKSTEFAIYPLTFKSIFKDRLWGGNKLKTVLNKNIPNNTTGESWEISTVNGDVSIVDHGIYQGQLLTDLIQQFPESILGSSVYKQFGTNFPLLFKYLDAQQDLSVQVHPNDYLAKKRHNSLGKTEMWYVMQAATQASILVGFKENSNQKQFLEAVKNGTIISLLNDIEVHTGDAFLLDTGTIHAIGAGILIAEIQQTSDITYRIYDFDRKDADGNLRELHLDLAMDAINYETLETSKHYIKKENTTNKMVKCPFFTVKYLPLQGTIEIQKNATTFSVYMCTDGNFTLLYNEKKYHYPKGQTVLIPAKMTHFEIQGNATLLEITI